MSVYYKENQEYLDLAIESIWDKQTLKPTEIILVEDGKLTDELYHILEKWDLKLGEIFKRIPLSLNQGLTKALNIGIEHCKCEFIARMDTDDISESSRFEKQIKFLENNPGIVLVGGSIQEFNSTCENIFIRKYPQSTEDIKKFISKASPLAHATVIFRRCIFDRGIRYTEKYRTSQDLELWYQLIKMNFKIANIPDIIYFFRVSNDFFDRRSKEKAINEFKIYWKGIISLYGLSFKLIYPILRLGFRFAPKFMIKYIYSSSIRAEVLSK